MYIYIKFVRLTIAQPYHTKLPRDATEGKAYTKHSFIPTVERRNSIVTLMNNSNQI